MRGPEENGKSTEQEAPNFEGDTCTENLSGRDPCSSPPCKRLKQGVLNFQSAPKQSTTTSIDLKDCLSVVEQDGVITSKFGGLVTAATSPSNKETQMSLTCDDDHDVMVVDITVTNQQSPKSPVSVNQDNSTSNLSNTPVQRLSSAEKKKRKEERDNMKEVKRKEKEEKMKQREQAKAAKEKERLEAKQKKEQERLERQAEKEKKEKDRLEKKLREEKEKQEKKEKREEERRKKEEEQNAKLEEKRKKEEEKKQQEEEMERKKLKARNSFKSFFTKTTLATPKTLPKSVLKFEPFEIKPSMSLAPLCRSEFCKESKQELDNDFKLQIKSNLYLQNLQIRKPLPPFTRTRRRKLAKKSYKEHDANSPSGKPTIPVIEVIDEDDDEDDDNSESSSVVEIQDDEKKAVHMKAVFLKFYENNRPPYYGTQRKRSKIISAKNPFKKDEAMLNYEVESDDEWEEEEPGESLSDSEPEDNNEEETEECDEEDEDGWMVPHGYLSDDEGIHEDDEEHDGNTLAKKEQQLAKAKAWEAELMKRCKAMRPVCIGCVWPDYNEIDDVLKRFQACLLVDGPSISITSSTSVVLDDVQKGESLSFTTPDAGSSTAMYVPEEAMLDLIHLIHGSSDGLDKLVNNFQQHWSNKCSSTGAYPTLNGKGHISKRQLSKKIRAIAKKESRLFDKPRWYVLQGVLASYSLNNLKAEPGVQEPNNRSISPPGAIKHFTKPVPEILKPIALPVSKLHRETFAAQSDESQAIKSSTTKHRIILQTVIPDSTIKKTTSMEHHETMIANPHTVEKPISQDKLPALHVTMETQAKQNKANRQHEIPLTLTTDTSDIKHSAAQMKKALIPGICVQTVQVKPENPSHQLHNSVIANRDGAATIQPSKSQSSYNGNNLKVCSQNAELQIVSFKRQIPSPECSIRASKVLKREDSSMNNNNFHNFSVNSHQVLQGDEVGKLEVQQC